MKKEYINKLESLTLDEILEVFGFKDIPQHNLSDYAVPLISQELSLLILGVNNTLELRCDEVKLNAEDSPYTEKFSRFSMVPTGEVDSVQLLAFDNTAKYAYLSIDKAGVEIEQDRETLYNLLERVMDRGDLSIPHKHRAENKDLVDLLYYFPKSLNAAANSDLMITIGKKFIQDMDGKNTILPDNVTDVFTRAGDKLLDFNQRDLDEHYTSITKVDNDVIVRYFLVKDTIKGERKPFEILRVVAHENGEVSPMARYSEYKWRMITKRSGVQPNKSLLTMEELDKLKGTRLEFLIRVLDENEDLIPDFDLGRVFFNLLKSPLILQLLEFGYIDLYKRIIRTTRDQMGSYTSVYPTIKLELPGFDIHGKSLHENAGLSARQLRRMLETSDIDFPLAATLSYLLSLFGKPKSVDDETVDKMLDLLEISNAYSDQRAFLNYTTIFSFIETAIESGIKKKEVGHLLIHSMEDHRESYSNLNDYDKREYINDVFELLKDIITTAGLLEIEPRLRFPDFATLVGYHDNLTDEYNEVREELDAEASRLSAEATKEKYKKITVINSNLLYEDENFQVMLPQDRGELDKEGRFLNHCVASYHSSYIAQRTVIAFIRRKDSPSVPYYTAEIKPNKTLIQCRTRRNAHFRDDPAMVNFVEEWSKEKDIRLLA